VPEVHSGSNLLFGGKELSIKTVDALIERVQRLIDSRPASGDPLAWYAEASYLGDLPAIAALAMIAALRPDQKILIVRELDAPTDRVYTAWTTPALVKQWWGGGRVTVESAAIDLRVGGEWRYELVEKDGLRSAFHGEYRVIVPGERIVSTERNEAAGGESVSTVVFAGVDGRTRLTLLLEFPSSEARDAALDSGMKSILEGQLNLLERVAASLG